MATTTPNYGWDVPTSTDYVKDGATAIETLGDDIDATLWTALGGAYPGLRLIKTQTIGSGVSTVSVTGAFSATYENYKILIANGVSSAAETNLILSLNGITTNYSMALIYGTYAGAAPATAGSALSSTWPYVGHASTYQIALDVDLYRPFTATPTRMSSRYVTVANAGTAGGYNFNSTSATAFTIAPTAGTLTGGTIYVYGYGAS
jgi:hypothetical protein